METAYFKPAADQGLPDGTGIHFYHGLHGLTRMGGDKGQGGGLKTGIFNRRERKDRKGKTGVVPAPSWVAAFCLPGELCKCRRGGKAAKLHARANALATPGEGTGPAGRRSPTCRPGPLTPRPTPERGSGARLCEPQHADGKGNCKMSSGLVSQGQRCGSQTRVRLRSAAL